MRQCLVAKIPTNTPLGCCQIGTVTLQLAKEKLALQHRVFPCTFGVSIV